MKRFISLLCSVLFIVVEGHTQDIEKTLAKYSSDYQQERAYLHYDKAAYAPGETIWFKIYMMEAIYPGEGSKSIYLDWSDDKGNQLGRTVSPIIEGTTNGQFAVPATYTGRYVHVKAYTKWMLNFDSSFLYNKDIRILNSNAPATGSKNVIIPSIEFFPEGGDMVATLVNKIAFKAHDQFGKPVKVTGVIQGAAGATIDSLRVQHDGMGFFYLSPKVGETFTAKWKDEKGTAYTTALPAVKPNGVSLQISSINNKRYFQITTANDANFTIAKLNVIGTMGQTQVFKLSKEVSAGEVKGVIPIQSLPSGILTVTVFDEQWKPLAERITYINNGEYAAAAEMEVTHWGLNKRARNEVQVTIPDSMVANLSVAVTDASIETDSTDNIISHLLLTGDLKGQVYNPSYYFSSNNDTIAKHLDLIMLTHGWRRFKWDDVVKGKFPTITYARDTSYLTLSGRLYGAMPSELRDNLSIVLFIKQKGTDGNVMMLPVDPSGTFNDPGLLLFDTAQIYYNFPKNKNLGDVTVKFLEGRMNTISKLNAATGLYSSVLDTAGSYRHRFLANQEAEMLKMYEGKVLEGVTVKGRTKTPLQIMDEKYTSGMFSGGDGYSFDLVNDPLANASMNIFTYLQGKVAGLQISNATSGSPSLTWRGGAPALYFNEMKGDPDMLASIAVSDIAYIKVFRPPFMGGFGGGNGAIAVYTKKGGEGTVEKGKGMPNSTVTGYTEIRQFFEPNYSSFKQDNEKKDLRTTLYWNPQLLIANGANKGTFSFYNNDITKAFRVIIEGMTSEGKLIRIEQIME